MAARIDDLLVLGQNISKTDLAKYLRDREAVLPFDFGGLGDGAANDRVAIQACFDRAAADKKFAVIPPGTWRVDAGVVLGGSARGLIMQGVIQYTGATNAPATVLTLGDGGTTRNGEKLYLGLQVTRQSGTEIGVEGACIMATSTTAETTMAALSWNGLNGITPTARGLLLNPNRGVGFVVQTTHAKEFALAHWLVGGADGGRLCLRCFDAAGVVRENIAGDALASGTTLQWAPTSKTWQAGAVMQESDLNRRQTVRFGPEVAFAQIGIIGFDGQIEVEALRLYGLPEDAPAILSGCPALPAGGRTLMYSASWDLPSMPPGTTSNADVTVPGARRGDFADASLDTSSIAFVLDCHVWSNDKVRVTARNVSLSTVDLPAAGLSVQVVKRKVG